jgi:hypothetical protein
MVPAAAAVLTSDSEFPMAHQVTNVNGPQLQDKTGNHSSEMILSKTTVNIYIFRKYPAADIQA